MMKLRKITKTLSIVVVAGVLLSGCSAQDDKVAKPFEGNFEAQEYETVAWDTDNFDMSAWSSGESGAAVVSPVNVLTPETISLSSEDSSCELLATIDYVESYKANRGDQFNSYDYLYTLAAHNTMNVGDVQVEKIAGVDFAVGEFEGFDFMFANRGEGPTEREVYRKTAVRVFDKLVEIPGAEETETGLFGSDVTKGLPAAQITVTCTDKEALTDKVWENGVDRLKFNFTGKVAPLIPDGEEVELTEEEKELLGEPVDSFDDLQYEEVPVNDQEVVMGEEEFLDDTNYEFVDDPSQADIKE